MGSSGSSLEGCGRAWWLPGALAWLTARSAPLSPCGSVHTHKSLPACTSELEMWSIQQPSLEHPMHQCGQLGSRGDPGEPTRATEVAQNFLSRNSWAECVQPLTQGEAPKGRGQGWVLRARCSLCLEVKSLLEHPSHHPTPAVGHTQNPVLKPRLDALSVICGQYVPN